MKKFINHVDHVAYISRYETLDANVAHLEAITGATLQRTLLAELGKAVCVDWSAGLEVVAPLPEPIAANQHLHDRLDAHGEGVVVVIYGVEDLEAHKAKLEARGYEIGPLMGGERGEPWTNILLRERYGPSVMGTWTIFSQIDYDDDVIRFVEVKDVARAG